MAKVTKGSCPVCSQELSDPDFETNRAQHVVLKCANCQTKLEWAQPLLYQWPVRIALLGATTALILGGVVRGLPRSNPSIQEWNSYVRMAGLILTILTLARIGLEKMGILAPQLKVTDRPYEDPTPYTTSVREQRALLATAPSLQINPHATAPSFLQGLSVLPVEDAPRIVPKSKT